MALHCGAQGVGYVVFEGDAVFDWGTVVARDDKNAMSLRKLARVLDRFSPETLVMEEAERSARRADRIVQLQSEIAILCHNRNIDVHVYLQAEVQQNFSRAGATTRQEIAEAVAHRIDVLSPRLPHPRKPWQTEARRMVIFSAAAVAMTHFAREPRS
jgi:Holliday junction resolvasome RuvABC endonuclease subunit